MAFIVAVKARNLTMELVEPIERKLLFPKLIRRGRFMAFTTKSCRLGETTKAKRWWGNQFLRCQEVGWGDAEAFLATGFIPAISITRLT